MALMQKELDALAMAGFREMELNFQPTTEKCSEVEETQARDRAAEKATSGLTPARRALLIRTVAELSIAELDGHIADLQRKKAGLVAIIERYCGDAPQAGTDGDVS